MPKVRKELLGNEDMLVLYAVNKAPDGVPTKTHYQKMMYLILKAMNNDPRSAGYAPNHFGPYSHEVNSWREMLIENGYLNKNSKERIFINPEAKKDVDNISFPDELLAQKINNIVKFICSLSYDELILFIYTDDTLKNEKMMIVNSDIKEQIFLRRVDLAKNMVRRGKVSIAKGAELADMDVESFKKLLISM